MCVKVTQPPLVVPRADRQRADGLREVEYTLALAKTVTKRPGGDHYSSRGAGGFTYPIGVWAYDQGFRPSNHCACLHFGTPASALAGELSSYGSHILISLPSVYLWGDGGRVGRCWHDAATLPIGCLTCDNLDLATLGLDEFWLDLWRARRLPPVWPPGDPAPPSALDFGTGPLAAAAAAGPLWRRSKVLDSG